MKTLFTLLFLCAASLSLTAQWAYPVDFEIDQEDTVWNQFANVDDDPENLSIVTNPDDLGLNTTANVLEFNVLPDASPWVGAWSDAYPDIEFTEENSTMYMMVYKDVVSNSGLKVEQGTEPAQIELKVPNTVTEEWELLAFDFSDGIGNTYPRLVFFPDFPDTRTEGSLCYVDLIGFTDPTVSIKEYEGEFMSVYPNPAAEVITVQYRGMKRISVTNMIGQTVREKFSDSNYIERVQVADLKSGVYFVTVESGHGMVTSKFIKE